MQLYERFRVCAALMCLAPWLAAAQEPASDKVSARDGVYSEAQAQRGEKTYKSRCGSCHQPEQFATPAFLLSWNGQTADALFSSIRSTMPPENPGSLKRQEYADLLAYLLRLNGLPAGETELESTDEALKRVLIEAPRPPTRPKGERRP